MKTPSYAQTRWARGFAVEYSGDAGPVPSIRIRVWEADEGCGTPILTAHHDNLVWTYFSADGPADLAKTILTPEWVKRVIVTPTLARELTGVYVFVAVDLASRTLIALTDRLGISPLYFAQKTESKWYISSHLMWLMLRLGHTGEIDPNGFMEHIGFGYTVTPYQELFRGIRRLPPAGYITLAGANSQCNSYWQLPCPDQAPPENAVEKMIEGLRKAMLASAAESKGVLGITAGKDSLCLASIVPPHAIAMTGTFGVPNCTDRVQGREVSTYLGIPHVTDDVCPTENFAEIASHIAFNSAGLATVSYVDMVHFVIRCVPPGSAFIMGEGGECVRDFFQAKGQNPAVQLSQEYMTPAQYLHQTLAASYQDYLNGYPDRLVLRGRNGLPHDDLLFASQFYRARRMPGNFGLRHQILSSLRPKLSPFLTSDFIDNAYGLKTEVHSASRLHRAIIEREQPGLLPFFDSPPRSVQSTQEWTARFSSGVGQVVYSLLAESLSLCADVFNQDGVLELCQATITQPTRALYHLFRVLSFALARRQLCTDRSTLLESIEESCFCIPDDMR